MIVLNEINFWSRFANGTEINLSRNKFFLCLCLFGVHITFLLLRVTRKLPKINLIFSIKIFCSY